MKVKYLFYSIIAAAFLMSAIPVDNRLEIGERAPKIETVTGTNVVNDANSEKKTRVISFWTPKKPASRISNRELSRKYSDDRNVEFISICTDNDTELMNEVMKIDNVKASKVFSAGELEAKVLRDYGMEEATGAFVISADGKILEKI